MSNIRWIDPVSGRRNTICHSCWTRTHNTVTTRFYTLFTLSVSIVYIAPLT